MKLFTKREYTKHEIVTYHSWVTYYSHFKNFDLELPGKAIILHIPIPFFSKEYSIDWDEIRNGWRFPVFILSWYSHRILLCYGNVLIADIKAHLRNVKK